MIIKCTECGKEVSSKAPACTHCGYTHLPAGGAGTSAARIILMTFGLLGILPALLLFGPIGLIGPGVVILLALVLK